MRALPQAKSPLLAALFIVGTARAAPPGAPPESNLCIDAAGPVAVGAAQWNGWGRYLDNTRYQPEPALRASDVPRLGVKWAFGFQGSTVAGQPTVVDGRVFVAGAAGRIYALDAKTGCTYWTFDAPAATRTPISIAELAPSRNATYKTAPVPRHGHGHGHGSRHAKSARTPAHLEILKAPSAAFFGDDTGAVYALDAQRGTLLWKTQVDGHPRARIVAAPTLYNDRLYVVVASDEPAVGTDPTYACCTFRGSVSALDMASGRVLWKTYTVAEEARPTTKTAAGIQEFGPAGVGISTAPTVDVKRGLLYVASAGSSTAIAQSLGDAVIAIDVNDGQVRWSKQFSSQSSLRGADFGAAPILRTLGTGKQILLAAQKSGIIYGLDPDHGGDVLWQSKIAEGTPAGGVDWGLAADHRSLFAAFSGLLADPQNPFGSLTALNLQTGMRRWYTPAPTPVCTWGRECPHAQSQAVTVIPGAAFSGSMDGHLRAYSTIDGKILWDFETATEFTTVNGVRASGGSLDQGGATIVNGVVYVNSGYGQRTGQPGNVLLAFSVDGK